MFERKAFFRIAEVYGRKKDLSDWKDIVRRCRVNKDVLEIDNFEFDTKNFLYFRAKAIKGDEPNSNGDYFPWDEIVKSYKTFQGCGLFIEHDSDDVENAKGIILEAVLDEDNKEVECLVAISKKDEPELSKAIQNGDYKSVSMGCIVARAICSICDNEATSMDDICDHMNPENPFTYIKGKVMPNGEVGYEKNYDITFKELSAVKDPAWEQADIISVKASVSSSLANHYRKYVNAKKQNEKKENIEKVVSKILDRELKKFSDEIQKEISLKDEKEVEEEKEEKVEKKKSTWIRRSEPKSSKWLKSD